MFMMAAGQLFMYQQEIIQSRQQTRHTHTHNSCNHFEQTHRILDSARSRKQSLRLISENTHKTHSTLWQNVYIRSLFVNTTCAPAFSRQRKCKIASADNQRVTARHGSRAAHAFWDDSHTQKKKTIFGILIKTARGHFLGNMSLYIAMMCHWTLFDPGMVDIIYHV